MLFDSVFPTPRTRTVDLEARVTVHDELHKRWLKSLSDDREQFAATVDAASRGICPVRDTYKENYRQFQKYLTTTVDMVEMIPQYVSGSLEFLYFSGLSQHEISTAGWGTGLLTRQRADVSRGDGAGVHPLGHHHLRETRLHVV